MYAGRVGDKEERALTTKGKEGPTKKLNNEEKKGHTSDRAYTHHLPYSSNIKYIYFPRIQELLLYRRKKPVLL